MPFVSIGFELKYYYSYTAARYISYLSPNFQTRLSRRPELRTGSSESQRFAVSCTDRCHGERRSPPPSPAPFFLVFSNTRASFSNSSTHGTKTRSPIPFLIPRYTFSRIHTRARGVIRAAYATASQFTVKTTCKVTWLFKILSFSHYFDKKFLTFSSNINTRCCY